MLKKSLIDDNRLHNVFGAKQKLANKPFTVVGNGKQTRDFIFVTDVVNAILLSMNSKINKEILYN